MEAVARSTPFVAAAKTGYFKRLDEIRGEEHAGNLFFRTAVGGFADVCR
jgi:hypothetical protein